jgi:transcriptional regulator with XRE-family HTH domain
MQISERLKAARWAWRASGKKQFELARLAGVDPTVLSGIFCGAVPITKPEDPRVLRIAKVLDVPPTQAFEKPSRQQKAK